MEMLIAKVMGDEKCWLLSWQGTPEAVVVAKDETEAERLICDHHLKNVERGTMRHWSWTEMPSLANSKRPEVAKVIAERDAARAEAREARSARELAHEQLRTTKAFLEYLVKNASLTREHLDRASMLLSALNHYALSEPPRQHWAQIADILDCAAESFGNHGCNDYELPMTEANVALLNEMRAAVGDGDTPYVLDPTRKTIMCMDWMLMRYFAKRLRGEAAR